MTSPAPALERSKTITREGWIDVAKGIAIVLVVLHHTWQFLGSQGWSVGWWDENDVALTTLRMPLFFTISGMLASSVVKRSFRDLLQHKVALLLYLYLLWSLARSIWFQFIEWPLGEFRSIDNFVLALPNPNSGLWYLYALAVFTIAVWALRKVSSWVLIPIFAAVSIAYASDLLMIDSWVFTNFLIYFLFFLTGSRYRALIFAAVKRSDIIHALALASLYLLLINIVPETGGDIETYSRVPLSILAVTAGMTVAYQLSRLTISRPLEQMGKQTLPIYVTHIFVLSLLVMLPAADGEPLAVLAFIGFALISIVVSLAVHRFVRIPGLYTLPKFPSRSR